MNLSDLLMNLHRLTYKKPLPNGETRDEYRKRYNRERYQKNREQILKYSREHYKQHKKFDKKINSKKLLEAMRQKVKDQKILLENDEPTRAEEELKRLTPEERKAFDEWYKQWKERTAS